MAKIEPSKAAKDLKALRRRLKVPLDKCAEAVGLKGASSYQHYEDKLKDPVQPLPVIRGLTPLFLEHGATIQEMADLAGVTKEHLSQFAGGEATQVPQAALGGTLAPQDSPDADSGDTLNREWLRATVVEMFEMRNAGILPELTPDAEADRVLRLYDMALDKRKRSATDPK